MKKLTLRILSIAVLAIALIGFQSCSEDAMPGEGEALTSAELETILSTDNIAGAADTALAELFAGNSAKSYSAREGDCYTAEYTETGFVATFNNCVLNGTDNVNGTVTVTYTTGEEASSFTATYQDFYVGSIKLNGTRSFEITANSEATSILFSVISDMSVEMEDGAVISENGTKTFGITFGDSLETTVFSLAGNWTVEANENTYIVETLEDLQGNASCEYLTSGAMTVSKNGLAVTVDFGNGECDDIATIIYPNGATEEITL
ncbi:MAG: hypothetical protein VX772_06400 [Bacteroidota bacterium]|uniref:Lipocalin-like domain-containing protein n=1 Tax=Flagellimonas okinawensis TaxID=3031324 RepID=A0ABT5XIK5_9FLAO|nr:hypothetical protein [[Muricauda] okinawensis]MDF0705719.1 hypothetical protein [[Muricauda] okinawensis]MEC8831970.1 hypothetical protein [Bacteroidota bacterium]